MGMKEHINYAVTKLSFSFSSSRMIPYGVLLIPRQMFSAIDFDRKVDRYTPPAKEYPNSVILKSMLIRILCGNADFEAIHETDDDPEYFCNAFHMKHLPSEATMRQRMDETGDSLRMANVSLFREYGIEPSALANGYAPIFAYIGTEGYLSACGLQEGKQHCQKDTPAFLTDVPRLAQQVTDRPLLFRLDSGNDSADNIGLFMEECFRGDRIHFIIRHNLRKEQPQEWLDEIRDVCTNIREPREGKKEYTGQTFRSSFPGARWPSVSLCQADL